MKKIIYYISILFTLLIIACSNEDIAVPSQTEEGGETCKLTFKVAIPQPSVASRAFNDGSSITINSLCLLMFDDHGLMVGRKLAESVTNPTLENDVYQGTYQVELSKTDEKRIIHFVANYSNNINAYPTSGNENSVLAQLNVSGTTDAYWQRMEVNGFKDSNGDGKVDNIGTVRLIRNFVAVKMEPAKNVDNSLKIDKDFLQGYVLYNEAKQGTVAPYFRNETGGFANYSTGISYTALTNNISDGGQGYIGVEPVTPTTNRYDNTAPQDADFTNTEKYTYERSYPTDNIDTPTFIIMKGLYNKTTYYYRVDIAQNFENLHLLRNFRYILQITKTCEGYTTINDAINGSSFNHLVDINIKVEEITDGETTLKVTPTDITVVNGTQNVKVKYVCTYDGEDDPTISVSNPFTPEIDESRVVISNITAPSGLSGELTVTLNSFFKEDGTSNLVGGLERQRFEVRTSNGLTREVRINLIDKINFNPTFVGPDGDGNYQYQYNLPSDLPECMFPLEIYFYEETGSFTPASGEQLSVDLIPNNSGRQTWRYKKVMTYQDYTQDTDKQFVAKFKSNGTLSETATYTMKITNEYAYNGSASLRRATIIKIEDNDATKDGELVWYVGETSSSQSASVTINNADVEWSYNTPTNFTVTRSDNTFTFTPKSMASEVEETFTVTTADGMTDELVLKVVEIDLAVTASLNPRTNVTLGLGQNVTLTLNFNKAGTVEIDAQRLNYDSNSAGTVNSSGNNITFTAPSAGEYTITFKTADAVRGGTVTISYDDEEITLTYSRASIGNKNVTGNNLPNGDINQMIIYYNNTQIGTCKYNERSMGSDRLESIVFDNNYSKNLTNEMKITITGTKNSYTYTIETTIGELINSNGSLAVTRTSN